MPNKLETKVYETSNKGTRSQPSARTKPPKKSKSPTSYQECIANAQTKAEMKNCRKRFPTSRA